VAGLPNLVTAMRAHGYGEDLIEKISWRNWVDVIGRTIGD
jgi:membrane dipeptidase